MKSEWNLSDTIFKMSSNSPVEHLYVEDVREFIKRLKEFVHEMEAPLKAMYGKAQMEISWKIEKLAGEKLV